MIIRECVVSSAGMSCLNRYALQQNMVVYCILRLCETACCDIFTKWNDLSQASTLADISFT